MACSLQPGHLGGVNGIHGTAYCSTMPSPTFFRCAAEGWAAASLPLDIIASGLYLKFSSISKGWGNCLAMDGKD